MGSLIQQIEYGKVTATLELLDQYGVTVAGLKKLRTKVSPAILKQLVAMIETGSVSEQTTLAAFETHTLSIGGMDIDTLLSKIWQVGGDEIDQSILRNRPNDPISSEGFIVLDFQDFVKGPAPRVSQLLNQSWLQRWSDKNLIGFELGFCSQVTALYWLQHPQKQKGDLWFASEPIQDAGDGKVFCIENRCGSFWLTLRDDKSGPCYGEDQIVFSLRKK